MVSTIRGSDNFDSAGAVLPTTYGAVGTYVLAHWLNASSQTQGTTVSGSNLYPANTYANNTGPSGYYTGGGTLSGTWRLMGALGYYSGTASINRIDFRVSLFMRIS